MAKKNKTVYILGAGFSRSCNAPQQTDILKEILKINISELDANLQHTFQEYLITFKYYMKNVFFISESKIHEIALEDIYTPIDRCILDNVAFRKIQPKELLHFRQVINGLIVIMMHHKLYDHKLNLNHIHKFAEYLVKIRSDHISADPFSILSTNWDIILDNALKSLIPENQGVVDYCCYVTPYKFEENIMPGLLARGKGMYNLKILKLHGSMNWLQCKRCQRLYVTFFEKIVLDEFIKEPKCRLCERNYHNALTNDGGATLSSQLIMPTFLKDLNNVQVKLIWQNAGVELSEANHIIFMGYSFPMADFELRQLLSKFIRHDAKIDVVLHHSDRPIVGKEHLFPEYRYRSFFGKREINISYDGAEHYINTLI